jgi:hypothetical protein
MPDPFEITNAPPTEDLRQGRDDPYWQDLHPNAESAADLRRESMPTAYDLKSIHDRFPEFSDDELKDIPVVPQGTRLEQGSTYVDLQASDPKEFTATGDMEAGSDNWYVPKSEVSYPIWNRLIGVQNPERLDQADEA